MELEAQGQANAIKAIAEAEAVKIEMVNQAIRDNFIGPAVEYKKLETALGALAQGTKVICGNSGSLVNVISDAAGIGVTPVPEGSKAIIPVPETKIETASAYSRALEEQVSPVKVASALKFRT
jgi:hypothetical protein